MNKIIEYIYTMIKRNIRLIINLLIVFVLFSCFGSYGIFTYLMVWVIYAIIMLIIKRDMYLATIRNAEYNIWGKPLDKHAWGKNEFKNTKLKLVWGKKNEK